MKWRKEPEDAVPTGDTRDAEDEGAVRTDAHGVDETREERERDGDMRERTEEVSPAFEAGAAAPMAAPPRTAAEIAAGAAAPDRRDGWVDDRADEWADDRVDDREAREPVGPLDTDADIRTTADTD